MRETRRNLTFRLGSRKPTDNKDGKEEEEEEQDEGEEEEDE